MKFDFVYLGQTVLKYEVPLEIFVGLNEIYEKQKKQLPKANKQLVGKIQDCNQHQHYKLMFFLCRKFR